MLYRHPSARWDGFAVEIRLPLFGMRAHTGETVETVAGCGSVPPAEIDLQARCGAVAGDAVAMEQQVDSDSIRFDDGGTVAEVAGGSKGGGGGFGDFAHMVGGVGYEISLR
jgi:hypothetical protein